MPNRIAAIAVGVDDDLDFECWSEPTALNAEAYPSFSDSISQDLIALENRFEEFTTPNSRAKCGCR